MNDLTRFFQDDDAEAIEIELCEAGEVAINQENDSPADIVANFAELVPGLSGGKTQGLALMFCHEKNNLDNFKIAAPCSRN
ncbi:MAG: hypothetical protein R3E01_12495 [Pirellulaceae bacterium]